MKHGIHNQSNTAGIGRLADYIKGAAEKRATVKIDGKSFVLRPFRLLLALLAVLVVVWVIGFVLSFGTDMRNVNVEFESGSMYSAVPAGDMAAMYNNRGVKLIDSRGEVTETISEALSQPLVEAEGDYMLLADLSGNHFAAGYKNGKQICRYNIDRDIISAKITSDGYAAVAADTDGYKGRVTVYNNRGSELYSWNSGSGYISDIAVTDNGRYLAVAQLLTLNGAADTKIQIIDTRRGEVIATADRSGELAAEIKFVDSNKLAVVTDSCISAYDRKGNQLFDISLAGKRASLYSLDSDECIAVVTMDNRGNHVLEMYSYSGKFLGSYMAGSEIRAVAARDGFVIVVEQKGIVRINLRGKQKAAVNVEHDIKSICCFDGGKRIIAIGSSQAETLRVN